MTPSDQHEEKKVQDALALISQNPKMSAAEAARRTRASYSRVWRRMKGVPRSSSRGGHNKKLDEPETIALREYLLMYYRIRRLASIDNTITIANSILCYQGLEAIASRW